MIESSNLHYLKKMTVQQLLRDIFLFTTTIAHRLRLCFFKKYSY